MFVIKFLCLHFGVLRCVVRRGVLGMWAFQGAFDSGFFWYGIACVLYDCIYVDTRWVLGNWVDRGILLDL